MATIQTAMRLTDMMTGPLRHITNAMDGMLSAWNTLESSTRSGLDVKNMEAVRAEIKMATQGLDELEKEQEGFNQKVHEGASAMDGMSNAILGAVGAFVGMQGIQKLVNLSDTYTQTQARLAMIVDEQSNVNELNDKIFASAQRARASYQSVADTVAKLSLNAGDAFDSNDETILFAENLNKLFAIAGTEQASIASASLQLTQALGSGVLRGEELNAVFEAAPNIMQTVADYMDVPIGKLRQMAQDGQITADVVKNALLSATGEINTKFESMPMTWGQVWTGVMNGLYRASVPVLNVISWMAQNWSILGPIVTGLATAVGLYTAALLVHNAVQWASNAAKTISTIAAVAHGAAITAEMTATTGMTAAQLTFNAALYACPLTWILLIIIAVIAAIYGVIAAINKVTGSTISATGVIVGVVMTALAFVGNIFVAAINFIIDIFVVLWNFIASFVNFFANVFTDPIGSIARLFFDLVDTVLSLLQALASAIDAIFGSNLAGSVQGWRDSLGGWVDDTFGKENEFMAKMDSESLHLNRIEYGDAWDFGYGVGENVDGFFGGGSNDEFSQEKLLEGMNDVPVFDEIAKNTGDTADALDITSENLKYLRDLAEQDAINRFTTAEVRVELGGVTNNVNSNMDLDGVVDYFVSATQEALERTAEGVHS